MEGRGADSRALDRHIRRGDSSTQTNNEREKSMLVLFTQSGAFRAKAVDDAVQEHRCQEKPELTQRMLAGAWNRVPHNPLRRRRNN